MLRVLGNTSYNVKPKLKVKDKKKIVLLNASSSKLLDGAFSNFAGA